MKRGALFLILSVVMIVCFQNCGQMFKPVPIQMQSLSASGIYYSGGCESEMMNLFQTTYYPTLRANCASCHTSGPGVGQFAHSNFQSAYSSFRSITRERVERNLTNPSHQPPYTGSQHQGLVDQYRPRWVAAEAAAAACAQGVSSPGDTSGSSGKGIFTLHKSNAQIVPRATTPNTWTRLEWDLQTEMSDPKLNNKVPLIIGIEARVATISNVRQGYEFRNPTLRLKPNVTGPFRVKGLHISINDKELMDVSTYEFLDVSVNSTTDVNIAPGLAFALAVMPNVATSDRFALEIGSILNSAGGTVVDGTGNVPTTPPPTNPLPTRVTFADLTSTDARLGVFRAQCLSCHGATNPRGGLNLSNYNQARAAINDIMSRMNNAANPMPPSGLLSQDPRDIIRVWMESGTPQN